jgi:Glycosyltransferases involved in cell wall biogenesis
MKSIFHLLLLCFVFFSSKEAAASLRKVSDDKTFVIVTSSYNNEQFCEQNLNSIFAQTYPHYRVIYIDDCSSDNTAEKVMNVVRHHKKEDQFKLIRNIEKKGATENYYRTINAFCGDDEVVVLLNGDDWLSDPRVLEYLNRYYSQADIWLTYGSYMDYPAMQRGALSHRVPFKVLKNGLLRGYLSKGFVLSPLQTFYGRLFKKIKLQDVLHQGAFLQSRADQAFMIPMVEMAGRHSLFVEDLVYVHNTNNPLNEEKINLEKRGECMKYLLTLKPYPLVFPYLFDPEEKPRNLSTDLVIFSYDRPLQLYACLESIQRYMTGVEKITVIYRTSNKNFTQAYTELQAVFKTVNFVSQSANYQKDFKPMLLTAIYGHPAEYVLFSPDDVIVKDVVNLTECVEAMEKYGARGFYLRLGKHVDYCYSKDCRQRVPDTVSVPGEILAWQFLTGDYDWAVPHSLDMTLFKKSEIHEDLANMVYSNPNSLENAWAAVADLRQVGLFFPESKIVNIPLNIVHNSSNRNMNLYSKEELLALFRNGMKMDIASLFRIKNRSAHIEFEPAFKRR